MRAYLGTLRCARCGRVTEEETTPQVCPACLEEGVNVYPWPEYDLRWVSGLPDVAGSAPRDVLAYAALLPLDAEPLTGLGEGDTPLFAVPRAGRRVGLPRLLFKDESRNPTWSYKDRLAVVAVNRAAQRGAQTLVVSSTGNHGAAVAAYAARLGLDCVVLTLESVPTAMKVLMQSYGARVVAFREPRDRWTVMREAVVERGWVPMSGYATPPSGSNPFGVDGYKTIAYELYRQLGGRVPDVVVTPVAYGDALVGMVRGFEDLCALGLVDRLPRMVAAEPHGPYAAGLASPEGETVPRPAPREPSVAFSIASLLPSWQGLWALRRTGGCAESASNAETMTAQQDLARLEGVFPEPSSAVAFAVLPSLVRDGRIGADETVVVIGTSTGLKDVGATDSVLPGVRVAAEATLAAFEAAAS
jgi:threonine synthase